ncbi:MAG: FKBP-type peptidyl-prolyl cis-trans isomerase [Prevotella sp.]|nr:FKBP-type peptidyl-prolyl cis-trans isomerase [Prevotella sp.]MDY4038460.1 FKBP-type peptidyl-prolyl cis-trans isomerase [Prevotella sp.]
MENQDNKSIAVAYQLYISDNDLPEMVEEATEEQPFRFLSGLGITLDAFEDAVVALEAGEPFDITLTPDQAYGNYEDERVLDLDKEMFYVDGRFDHEHIFKDAVVPLQNEDGNRFMGRVLDIADTHVRIDLNHPLAGKTLRFKGHVVESRKADNQEIQDFINQMSGNGCGGGCGNCGDGCGGGCEGGGCGCH